ncbi:MAG: hypothetical protein WDW38_011281 [Sanguina aurantia]
MSNPTGAWLLEQPMERQTPEIKVEFYRRDNLKLDHYRGSGRSFTGTVKTSITHPTQGKTQMFRRNLTEAQFKSVLQNPSAQGAQK